MKESKNNWVSRLHQRTKRHARQRGVTLQEILIGIAVAAIVAGTSIVLGVRFLGTGQEGAARQTLQTAIIAAEANYARIVPGGSRNFAGVDISSVSDAATAYTAAASEEYTLMAVRTLNTQGEDLKFVPWFDTASECESDGDWIAANKTKTGAEVDAFNSIPDNTTLPICVSADTQINLINDHKTIWVQVLDTDTTNDMSAGQTLRLGTKAGNGSTMCAILVKRSTDSDNLGRGYQAVNEDTSTATPADCGLGAAATDELPGSKTDNSPGEAKEDNTDY